MIKFLVRSMHLEADQDLAQMKKHTQKRTFLGMFFAQGMFFFCQQTWPKTAEKSSSSPRAAGVLYHSFAIPV
jgi:hypothetical protein